MKQYIIWLFITIGVLLAFLLNGVPGKWYAYFLFTFYCVLFILIGINYYKK